MKRTLIAVNLALLAGVSLLTWYLRAQWTDEEQREMKIMRASLPAAKLPAPPPLRKVGPLAATEYVDFAAKTLFVKDRNATPIPDPPPAPPPPKPMPPLPVAHGVMFLGDLPPAIVLSEGKGAQKSYRPGDRVGDFKLVSVNNKEVVFDWDGKEVRRAISDLMSKDLTPAPDTTPPPKTAAAAPQKPTTSLSSNKSGPGDDVGGGVRSCVPGDAAPSGAVVDGWKKTMTTTPFGSTCKWEQAR